MSFSSVVLFDPHLLLHVIFSEFLLKFRNFVKGKVILFKGQVTGTHKRFKSTRDCNGGVKVEKKDTTPVTIW